MESGWEEALEAVVRGIRSVQEKHGKDGFGVYSGSSMTNEKCYLAGKFARVAIGTRHIDYNGRLCMSSAGAAYNKALGIDRWLNWEYQFEDLIELCMRPRGAVCAWKQGLGKARLGAALPLLLGVRHSLIAMPAKAATQMTASNTPGAVPSSGSTKAV